MAYTQYSLQLHIHINTKSTYISYVNVILFKHRRKEKQCNIMLNFHSTWSLMDHRTAFPVVGWMFIFQFHYYLSSEGTWAWVEDSRWRTTQGRVRGRRSARESSWKHWDGLRCLGNSIYSTLLETQRILLRHLQNIGTEFGDWTVSFDLFNYNLKYHYFYFLKKTSTICMDAWMIDSTHGPV